MYEQNVAGLAALPTTLFFLLDEFREGGAFGRTHRELFKRGCQRLAREHDPRHIEMLRALRKTAQISTPEQIYEASCRLAALFLLCGKSVIHLRSAPEAQEDADLHLSQAADGAETGYAALTENMLEDATASALFTSRGPNRVEFAHQTFAECLAAQVLSRLPLVLVRTLLCARDAGDEHVIPQLAETAAWVAGINGDFFEHLCRIEPEALLRSDVSEVQNHRKKDLVAAILEKAKKADLFDERYLSRFLGGLKHPELANQLRPWLADKTLNVVARRIALSIARECKLADLSDDLLRIIHDPSESQAFRDQAAQTLAHVIPTTRLANLIPLASGQINPDPDDTIRGSAIQRIVPEMWSVSQAVPYLHAPRNGHFLGTYHFLLKYHLPRNLKDEDVPLVLEQLIAKTHCFDRINPFEELAETAFVRALHSLSKPDVRQLAVKVWMTKATTHQPLPRSRESAVVTLFQERGDLRREFLAAIVDDPGVPVDNLVYLRGAYVQLILQDDLEWALDRISQSSSDRRKAWASVISSVCCPNSACKCWDLLLQRINEIPELSSTFSLLRAWNIEEPIARSAKASWLKHKRLQKRLNQLEAVPNMESCLKQDFADIAAGKAYRWIELCGDLSVKRDETCIIHPLGHDLTKYPGWVAADERRQTLIRTAARGFLLKNSDGYAEIGSRTNFSDPGYIAVWLLRSEIRTDVELRSTVASKWIDALIGRFNGGSDHYQETAALAYELNPDATLRGFIRELKEDDKEHGQIPGLYGFQKCWDDQFTAAALNLIRIGNLKAGSIESILQFVAPISPKEAAACARPLLDSASLADPANEERTVSVLAACIAGMPTATWDFCWPIIETNLALAEKVFLRIADRIVYDRNKCLPVITERQLADLYLRIHSVFPRETDPDMSRGGFVTPRQSVARFRGDVIGALESRGTEKACHELLRLANALPSESLWFRSLYYNTRRSKRRKSWTPPRPQVVLGLLARREARLVVDADDLTEVVVESLDRLQTRLTRSTLPESEILWHWDGADTQRRNFRHRDEAFLSDYIARWFRDDLGQRRIVIGREVQPRRGQRIDIYVSAGASGTTSSSSEDLTVVIEVKGCWNADVRKALEGQLVGEYLRPNGLTHGIYLVGWFVCEKWSNPENHLASETLANAQHELLQLAAPYDGKTNPERVTAMVLDCRYPESTTT